MNYELKCATENDIPRLIDYELKTIFEYAENLTTEEVTDINEYVKNQVITKLENYKIIFNDNNEIGCLLITNNDDSISLDEIYLEKDYRNKGIGTKIIKKLISENKSVCLWVYKLNEKAISLYKKLGFEIIDETENRYYMKYNR